MSCKDEAEKEGDALEGPTKTALAQVDGGQRCQHPLCQLPVNQEGVCPRGHRQNPGLRPADAEWQRRVWGGIPAQMATMAARYTAIRTERLADWRAQWEMHEGAGLARRAEAEPHCGQQLAQARQSWDALAAGLDRLAQSLGPGESFAVTEQVLAQAVTQAMALEDQMDDAEVLFRSADDQAGLGLRVAAPIRELREGLETLRVTAHRATRWEQRTPVTIMPGGPGQTAAAAEDALFDQMAARAAEAKPVAELEDEVYAQMAASVRQISGLPRGIPEAVAKRVAERAEAKARLATWREEVQVVAGTLAATGQDVVAVGRRREDPVEESTQNMVNLIWGLANWHGRTQTGLDPAGDEAMDLAAMATTPRFIQRNLEAAGVTGIVQAVGVDELGRPAVFAGRPGEPPLVSVHPSWLPPAPNAGVFASGQVAWEVRSGDGEPQYFTSAGEAAHGAVERIAPGRLPPWRRQEA